MVIGIHIPANQRVYLNTTPTTPIPILWIEGELVFDECHGVMDFPAGAILVDGNLQIGTAQNPYTVDASVTFSDLTLPTDTQLIEAGISDAAARAALLDYTARNAPLTVFPGARGTLDAFGDATATATFAPGQAAAWAGRTIRFSAVTLAAPGDAGNYSAGMRVSIVN